MTKKKELESILKIQSDKLPQLLQSAGVATDLEDYAPHVQKLTEILSLIGGDIKTYPQAVAKWKETHALKTNGDRPLPSFAGNSEISMAEEIFSGTGLKEALDKDAEEHAIRLAESIARAPFDGVTERYQQIAEQAEASKVYGAQMVDFKLTGKLNDPAFVKDLVADIQKKREASK